jgi:hypothetical protein
MEKKERKKQSWKKKNQFWKKKKEKNKKKRGKVGKKMKKKEKTLWITVVIHSKLGVGEQWFPHTI